MKKIGLYLTLLFVAMGAAIALYVSPLSVWFSSSSISITCPPSRWSPLDICEPRPELERRCRDVVFRLFPALCEELPATFRFALWLGNSWKNLLLRLLPRPFASEQRKTTFLHTKSANSFLLSSKNNNLTVTQYFTNVNTTTIELKFWSSIKSSTI